ncbi:MAG: putative hydro-lyase [Cyanobacteria bacterium J06598_3]
MTHLIESLNTTLPVDVRKQCRRHRLDQPTSGLALGYVQTNLVVLPSRFAFDFMLFCQRNPKPCPVLEVLDMGSPAPRLLAKNADIRTDLPRYRVFCKGELIEEPVDINALWQDDFVAFLIGCSFSFEEAMLKAGLTIRHIEERKNVPMYRTNINCESTQYFSGPMVVSMRPLPGDQIVRAVEITSRYGKVHGSPVHVGDPQAIGIQDLSCPDYGEAVTIKPGEIPVFWACGVTPQAAIMQAKPELAITHAPGHMFVSDIKNESLQS